MARKIKKRSLKKWRDEYEIDLESFGISKTKSALDEIEDTPVAKKSLAERIKVDKTPTVSKEVIEQDSKEQSDRSYNER